MPEISLKDVERYTDYRKNRMDEGVVHKLPDWTRGTFRDLVSTGPELRVIIDLYPTILESRDRIGRTVAHELCFCNKQWALELLIHMMQINISCINMPDSNGHLPLHMAAQEGRLEMFKIMSDAFPEMITHASNVGRTPLHFAAQQGHLDICGTFRVAHNLTVLPFISWIMIDA